MSPPVKVGDVIDLKIDRLSFGGDGVGRHQDFVVFVPKTAPDDLVRAEIVQVKKSHSFAQLKEILKPSPSRRTPECTAFGRCGGCSWQHVKYEEQVRQKELMLRREVQRLNPECEVHPIVASPTEFRYRHRIQMHTQKGKIGYFQRESHEFVAVDDCLITDERITSHFDAVIESFKGRGGRVELGLDENTKFYTLNLEEEPYNFTQANVQLNEKLVELVTHAVSEAKPKSLLELYCGSGNFSFPILEKIANLNFVGVELNPRAIAQAKRRAQGVAKNIQFIAGDSEEVLKKSRPGSYDTVLVDPPRNGLSAMALKGISRLQPRSLIYVSCNPVTFVRDARELTKGGSLALRAVWALDMFPQTDHFELIAIFH